MDYGGGSALLADSERALSQAPRALSDPPEPLSSLPFQQTSENELIPPEQITSSDWTRWRQTLGRFQRKSRRRLPEQNTVILARKL